MESLNKNIDRMLTAALMSFNSGM